MGNFNKGKSHLANCLCGVRVDEGFNIHTLGPSLVYSRKDNFGYLDSAGFEVPIKREGNENGVESRNKRIFEKQITDEIQREFLIESSDVLIIVVGILSISEQKMINLIGKQYRNRKKYVIHNFYQLSNYESIINKIQTDILYSFNTIPMTFSEDNETKANEENKIFPFYFLERETLTFHFVIANSFSKSKTHDYNKLFNDQTFSFIRLTDNTPQDFRFKQNFMETYEKLMKKLLKNNECKFQLDEETEKDSNNDFEIKRLKLFNPPKDFDLNVDYNVDGQLNFSKIKDQKEYFVFIYPFLEKTTKFDATLYIDLCLTAKEAAECELKEAKNTKENKLILIYKLTTIKIDLLGANYEIKMIPGWKNLKNFKLLPNDVYRSSFPIQFR